MEKLKINDVRNKHMIDKESVYFKNLTEREQYLCKNFYRVELTGKRCRNIHILIDMKVAESLGLFIETRHLAVFNHRINLFAGKSGHTISASSSLEMFSKQCNAKRPEALRSTMMRKSIATFTQLLCMSDTDMHNFATFIGHNCSIHHDFYKLPSDLTQIARLNKVLLHANNNEASKIV